MRLVNKLLIASIMPIALTGCREVDHAINLLMNGSSVYALEKCIAISDTKALTEETIYMNCAKKVDKLIKYELTEATARIDRGIPFITFVNIKNNSDDFLITRANITFEYYPANQAKETISHPVPISIEPRSEEGVSVNFGEISHAFSQSSFCSEVKKVNCFAWDLEAYGVSID